MLSASRIAELSRQAVNDLLMRSKPGEIDGTGVATAIRQAVNETQEACAMICDELARGVEYGADGETFFDDEDDASAKKCADAIRNTIEH